MVEYEYGTGRVSRILNRVSKLFTAVAKKREGKRETNIYS